MKNSSDYQAIIRATMDGFWVVDKQARFLDVNDAYCEMIGYTRDELLAMNIADVEVDEKPADVARHMQELKAHGFGRFEARHRTKWGNIIEIEVSANYDHANDQVFVFLRDVTAKQATHKLLRAKTNALSERVKEMRCLQNLANLLMQRDLPLGDVLQKAIELLPPACQDPSATAAQLILPGAVLATENYQPTPWAISRDFTIGETNRGHLTLGFLKSPGKEEDCPFLPEEQQLLATVAQRLGEFIDRRRAEESLLLREKSLNALLELSQLASTLDERDIIQMALEEVELLTSSQIGYLHFVNPDQNSIQLFTWSRRTLASCNAVHAVHYPIEQAGRWADCARTKQPAIHNDYQHLPNKQGCPPGHVHLIRHLSVPVVEDDSVKLIIGVGNKAEDYDEGDVRQMLLTAGNLWRIIRRKRAEDEARLEAEHVFTLARVAARLNSQLDLSAVLQTICKETVLSLNFPSASVYLFNDNTREFEHAATVSNQTPAQAREVGVELAAVLNHTVWDHDVVVPSNKPPWISALHAVRLKHADRILGTLAVYSIDDLRRCAFTETTLLLGLANEAAQAIVNARLFTEVEQKREQLQTLSRRLVEVQEAERRTIAQELHDEVGQVLTAVKINLQMLRRQEELAHFGDRLDQNIETVQRALDQVRSLSLDLRPSILDDLGLSAALEWYVLRLSQMSGLTARLSLPEDHPRWPPAVEIACFRVAQEALTNIMRHAKADTVWIELDHSPSQMQMRIRDDGQGFEPNAARLRARSGTSVGLLSMAERVALAGGQIEIESSPGKGTRIQVLFKAPALH